MRFQEGDIGKRVLLTLDVEKLDEKLFESEGHVSYESIKSYEFLKTVTESKLPKIKNTGTLARRINPVSIAKIIGVDTIMGIGDIVEVTDDYLKIQ